MMRWYPKHVCIALLALSAGEAVADLLAGKNALAEKDYPTALSELNPVAEDGNREAQVLLAEMYRKGLGVERDQKAAFDWSLEAAQLGSPEAQYNLGVHYREGLGTEQDQERATEWFRRAARQNYIPAIVNMGVRYAKGTTVPRDDVIAFAWLTKALLRGNAEAMRARRQLEKRMSGEEIARGRALAKTVQ